MQIVGKLCVNQRKVLTKAEQSYVTSPQKKVLAETAIRMCSIEKLMLKMSQISQKKRKQQRYFLSRVTDLGFDSKNDVIAIISV